MPTWFTWAAASVSTRPAVVGLPTGTLYMTPLLLGQRHLNDHFDDCADRYLFTRDRDNQRAVPDGFGCSYRFADALTPEDPTPF